jgi:Ca2+-binding EF-hand superfamily protein
MKRQSIIALSMLAATAFGSATVVPAFAHGHTGGMASQNVGHDHAGGMMSGNQGMMPMMMQMHRQMMGGMGPMSGMESMGRMMEIFDEDSDGIVSADEMRAGLADQLVEYDEDGDGNLSIAEFETLHNAMFRARMVDRFQVLDEDGDGQVTGDEMAAPARRIERMEQMRTMIQPGQPGVGTMMDDDNGSMMDNN